MNKTIILAVTILLASTATFAAQIQQSAPVISSPATPKAVIMKPVTAGTASSSSSTPSTSGGTSYDAKTEREWRAKCAFCHGESGKGDTAMGKQMAIGDFSTSSWQAAFTDDKIQSAIFSGLKRQKNGVNQEMDAYRNKLRPEQIVSLVAYIRNFNR